MVENTWICHFDENMVFSMFRIGAVPPDTKDKDGYIAKLNQKEKSSRKIG